MSFNVQADKHAWKTCTSNPQIQTNAQTRIENCLGLTGTSCFWSSHGRYPRPLWFDISTAPVCVCEHRKRPHFIKCIPHSGLSLSSPKWNNSLFLDFVCLEFLQARVFHSFAAETAISSRKLIIDFIRQWGCGPLQAESQRLERTLPEWVHFLHNPPQSSSSHHCAAGEPVWHIEDYCAMLSLDVNTRWPVKCSWTKLQQPVVAVMREQCIRGVKRKTISRWSETQPHF